MISFTSLVCVLAFVANVHSFSVSNLRSCAYAGSDNTTFTCNIDKNFMCDKNQTSDVMFYMDDASCNDKIWHCHSKECSGDSCHTETTATVTETCTETVVVQTSVTETATLTVTEACPTTTDSPRDITLTESVPTETLYADYVIETRTTTITETPCETDTSYIETRDVTVVEPTETPCEEETTTTDTPCEEETTTTDTPREITVTESVEVPTETPCEEETTTTDTPREIIVTEPTKVPYVDETTTITPNVTEPVEVTTETTIEAPNATSTAV